MLGFFYLYYRRWKRIDVREDQCSALVELGIPITACQVPGVLRNVAACPEEILNFWSGIQVVGPGEGHLRRETVPVLDLKTACRAL